jgi:signal transduction histidine kinase
MVSEKELGIIILLGMTFVFFMSLGMFMLARKNRIIHELGERLVQEEKDSKEIELLHNTISSQETERNRIARRLHDEVGALLSIVSKNLTFVEDSFKKGNVNKAFFYNAVELLNEGTHNLRNIFKELMPHYLVRFGLAESLNRMATQKTKHVTDEFEFIDDLTDDIELNDELMMHYFYIASELITNLLKHSHPNAITMKICLEDQNLLLSIQHDGITLTQDDYLRLSDNTENLGLENIRYRLNIIQAQIFFKRENNIGVICLLKQID